MRHNQLLEGLGVHTYKTGLFYITGEILAIFPSRHWEWLEARSYM